MFLAAGKHFLFLAREKQQNAFLSPTHEMSYNIFVLLYLTGDENFMANNMWLKAIKINT